ncbi:hypothetical protein KKC59_04425, partial [bacterium]|nr:hypothetical protein [bacterium]
WNVFRNCALLDKDGYNGSDAEALKKAIKQLLLEKKMTITNAKNGVLYSHSFISIEFLRNFYLRLIDVESFEGVDVAKAKNAVSFFLNDKNLDLFTNNIEHFKRSELTNGTLFSSLEYLEHLEYLSNAINGYFLEKIIKQDKPAQADLDIFEYTGPLWARQDREDGPPETPCPNIQQGFGHSVNLNELAATKSSPNLPVAIDYDSGAGYAFNLGISKPKYVIDSGIKDGEIGLFVINMNSKTGITDMHKKEIPVYHLPSFNIGNSNKNAQTIEKELEGHKEIQKQLEKELSALLKQAGVNKEIKEFIFVVDGDTNYKDEKIYLARSLFNVVKENKDNELIVNGFVNQIAHEFVFHELVHYAVQINNKEVLDKLMELAGMDNEKIQQVVNADNKQFEEAIALFITHNHYWFYVNGDKTEIGRAMKAFKDIAGDAMGKKQDNLPRKIIGDLREMKNAKELNLDDFVLDLVLDRSA